MRMRFAIFGFLLMIFSTRAVSSTNGGSENCRTSLGDLVEARREVKLRLEAEAQQKLQDDDWWGVDAARKPENRPYETEFGKLLGNYTTFDQLVSARKHSGNATNLLDLFGSGVIVSDYDVVDSATGVRLKDVPVRAADRVSKRQVVEGDLFKLETWERLKENLAKRQVKSLDIITIRPVGAFSELQHELAGTLEEVDPKLKGSPAQLEAFNRTYLMVLRRAYSLLSADSGEMYVRLPVYANGSKWRDQLEANHITTELYDGSLKLTKTRNSPEKFPNLEAVPQ